ncbi:MAG: hypothetical protein JW723_08810 [Bacteroidales bacterium]|nr:hypothetical protein [Bacteroidales bacterium]
MKKSIILVIAVCLTLSCEHDDPEGIKNPDNINMLVTSIFQNGHKYLEFTYDSLNRLIHSDMYFNDTSCSRTTYSYDRENRLIEKSYDGFTEFYEYHENGLPESVTRLYNETGKVWKRIYLIENNRITGAEIYYNEIQTDYAVYEYDNKGNTREIKEYPVDFEDSGFIMIHQKFSYDDAINPLSLIGYTAVDMVQSNNPTYSYFGNALMCMGPVEYDATFEYDDNGLPLVEYRSHKGRSDTHEYTYNYRLIAEK